MGGVIDFDTCSAKKGTLILEHSGKYANQAYFVTLTSKHYNLAIASLHVANLHATM